MFPQRSVGVFLLAVFAVIGLSSLSTAEAKRHYHRHGYSRHYYNDHRRGVNQADKILKGGLVGAGIGAGAGVLLDRPVGKTALVGAGIGAGTQAVRYSRTMRRHPIAKTAAYGALTGTGVSAVTGKSLGKGALWGGGIGAAVGAIRDF